MHQINYDYYEWLVSEIAFPQHKSFNDLFDRLHNTEFTWFVPNDDNRVQDALDLRTEFLDGRRRKLELEGATLLEVVVSLSRRVEFTAGGDSHKWAWKLIKNLRLHKATDPLVGEKAERVENILYNLVWRTYKNNGQGGFFPLKDPKEDQTKVEIWYQMNAYVIEMDES